MEIISHLKNITAQNIGTGCQKTAMKKIYEDLEII